MRKTANLAARKDNKRNLEETFKYDHLNRLTDIWLNDVHTGHMAYDALGRMTDKRTDGQNVFSSAQHDYVGPDGQLRPHAISTATVEGNPFPTTQLDIDYTMFDKVRKISFGNKKKLFYAYGYDHQRTMMYETDLSVTCMKYYVGNCEFVSRQGIQQELTYLNGPMGVFAVVENENGVESVHYVLKDNLGSWTTITDAQGNIEQEVSFDAWGNPRNANTWSGEYSSPIMFDRGFTGHEHLYFYTDSYDTPWFNSGLINMNGRMYDPIMSSFLSVDNYVQAPDFSQSFNRYAYCLNNPLKYTDPSGEIAVVDDILIAAAIGAAISMASNALNNVRMGEAWYTSMGQAAVLGAFTGIVGAGVGSAVASSISFGGFAGGFISGTAGGFAGGFFNGLYNPGSYGADFGESCLNALISGGIGALSGGIMGGLSRGIADYRNGYGFWDGKSVSEFVEGSVTTIWDNVADEYNGSAMVEHDTDLLKVRLLDKFGVKEGDYGIRTISTKVTSNYGLNEQGQLFNLKTGKFVGGHVDRYSTGKCDYYLSPYNTHSDDIHFVAKAGHELIHAYHNYVFPTTFHRPYSERVAYKYTFDVYFRKGYYWDAYKTYSIASGHPDGFWGVAPNSYSFHPFMFIR